MAYSSGKNAYGICDISGFRYKLNEMKKTWNGLLVGPDMYDPKHPQLEPRKITGDPEAICNPRPDVRQTLSLVTVRTTGSTKNADGTSGTTTNNPFADPIGTGFTGYVATSSVGEVTVVV